MKIPQFDDDDLGYLTGIFDATVVSAKEGTSKSSGNPMITLKLEVVNRKGEKISVTDYLVATREKMCIDKIQGFSKSAGLDVSDELTAAVCEGAEVQVACKIEDDDEYGRQTKIARYVGPSYARSVSESNADVVGADPGRDPDDPI